MTDDSRRALVLDLLRDDIASGTATLWRDVYPLIRECNRAELDRRGVLIYIARWQAERGREAWSTAIAVRRKLETEVSR